METHYAPAERLGPEELLHYWGHVCILIQLTTSSRERLRALSFDSIFDMRLMLCATA